MTTVVDSTAEENSESDSKQGVSPQAHLFRVVDCARPLLPPSRHSLAGVRSVLIGRGSNGPERSAERGQMVLRLLVPDPLVSSAHARLYRSYGRWLVEDAGSRNGVRVGGERIRTAVLKDGDAFELGRTFFLFRDRVATSIDDPVDLVANADAPPGLDTLNPTFARSLRAVRAIAPSKVSVIIHGETGTGKELVARALHALSGRQGPFVPLNCGAIPGSLVESELFGARRGAYSDAKEDRPGHIRSADGGTLFLDEIGDLPLPAQMAFLRALQEGEVQPIGQARPVSVDFRVVSATHRDLDELVARGEFRTDLYARLSGITISVPPLRMRRDDLGLLLGAIVRRHAGAPDSTSFAPETVRFLLRHDWPWNVRELEKRIAAALVLCRGAPIAMSHLAELRREGGPAVSDAVADDPRDSALRAELSRLLEESDGNVSAVARRMNKERVQVRRWLKRFGIRPVPRRRSK